MNMNENPTAEQLAKLFGAKNDDEGAYSLWVDQVGGVHLDITDDTGSKIENARLRYASFEAAVGFVGEDAATDSELMGELLASLIEHWAAAQNAPPGTRLVDLDDPEAGPSWTMTEVAIVDDNFLNSLNRGTSR